MRIPRRITLPFGYVVSVRQVTRHEMKKMDGADADGLWDVDTKTIFVVRNLPAARKRWALMHECHHVVADAIHSMVNEGVIRG